VSGPLLVALVGTDHHPFDRLVDWADGVAVRHPEVHVLVQHGASKRPLVAEGRPFIGHHDLRRLLGEASAVICHGGPGTIMDARDAGHVPICVPRDPRLGEHVDGHQLRFAALVAGAGVTRSITDVVDLHPAVDAALRDRHRVRTGAVPIETRRARQLLAAELEHLVHLRPTRFAHLRRSVT
jgi:UDP-N-acetylglucosamine transferase subunit ALG13